jgi:glycosyltransferase involved in cell wall biosynthesis
MTDTFGQVILEAQASGLPVLAVRAGGPAELIDDGRTGCLVAPETKELASAIQGIARREAPLRRLATGAQLSVRERTWERSLAQLAAGYAKALGDVASPTPLSPDCGMREAA